MAEGEDVGIRVGMRVEVRMGVAEGEAEGRANTPVARPGMMWINLAKIPVSLRLPMATILWPTAKDADVVATDLDLIMVFESKKTVNVLSL